jgi:three-Cys-motif partner protein
MSSSDDHFERFAGHTLLKHRILRSYLSAWAIKLLQGQRNTDVYFIDAFAGEGRDKEGNPGSPLIAARIAATVGGNRQPGVEHPRQLLHIYAIENLAKRVCALTECLAPFTPGHPGHVEVRLGELPELVDEILEVTKDAATLYFLDPFGIKGLDASTYPKALRGPQNEIFALFADMGVSRLYGLATAGAFDLGGKIDEIRSTPDLFADWDQHREAVVTRDAQEHRRALDASQPNAQEHLTRALGGTHWKAVLEGQAPAQCGALFLGLFIDKLFQAGAKKVMTMPMRDENGIRVYSLVHASKSGVALETMKEAVSGGLNKKDLVPSEVAAMIRQDLTVPFDRVAAYLRGRFGGRPVFWSEEVKPALLTETAVFHFQATEIRKQLQQEGWLERGAKGKVICRIPATP